MFNVLLSTLSAVLLILSFPKADFSFCAWFALVPWLFAIQKKPSVQAFLISYLTGVVFFSGIVYWVNYVSSLGFTILVLYLALYFAVFGLVFNRNPRPFSSSSLFIIPSVWVALEYIRNYLFSGFGWAFLGYSQYLTLPIIQISDITGAYGVSFLVVLVNLSIFQAISIFLEYPPSLKLRRAGRVPSFAKASPFAKATGDRSEGRQSTLLSKSFGGQAEYRKRFFFSVLCSLFSVLLVLTYGYIKLNYKSEGENVKVAVVQGNIPQKMKWDLLARDYILEKYFHLTQEMGRNHPDIIIWPETSVPGFLESEAELLEKTLSLSKRVFPSHLLVGTPQEAKGGRIYNSATLLFQDKVIQRYDKLHLVPFGEFIPWPSVFSRFSFAGLIGNFVPGENYTVFTLLPNKPDVTFSVLICFEDVFAHLTRRFVKKGAKFLVNMTNDAWFESSSEPYQHLQVSVFRAVENRVNVVRSANTGVSCFINPYGEILNRVSDCQGRDILVAGGAIENLQIVSRPSFYTKFGDIFAWLCLTVTLFGLGAQIKKRS